MTEKAGLAANIALIIKLSGEVATLCTEYAAANTNNADIAKLQSRVEDLGTAFKAIQKFVESRHGRKLTVSQETLDVIVICSNKLSTTKSALEEGKQGNSNWRLGARTLKWPWRRDQLNQLVSKLDRYEQVIILALEPDKT